MWIKYFSPFYIWGNKVKKIIKWKTTCQHLTSSSFYTRAVFVYSLNKYLPSTYYVPGTNLEVRDMDMWRKQHQKHGRIRVSDCVQKDHQFWQSPIYHQFWQSLMNESVFMEVSEKFQSTTAEEPSKTGCFQECKKGDPWVVQWVKHQTLVFTQGMNSGLWEWAPHQALQWSWRLLKTLSPSAPHPP